LTSSSLPAHAYCADAVRRLDRHRYLTAVLAPPDGRKRLLALYALNLELAKASELTSEPMLAEIRLTWWREAVAELYAGTPRKHMVVEALADAQIGEWLRQEELEALIEIRIEDLEAERFASLDDLVRFAEDSAGALASLAIRCLGEVGDDLAAVARDVGTAWGLTGLMRSLPRTVRARRLYLPKDGLARLALSPAQVYAGAAGEALRPLVGEVLAIAERRIEAARRRCPRPPRWSLPVLLLAQPATIYLDCLRRQDCDAFAAEVNLGPIRTPLALAWHHWRGRL